MRPCGLLSRRRAMACIGSLALTGCFADMKPPRPYAVPFDLSKAGHTVKFEIEVVDKDVGVALRLVFHHENDEQRKYLFQHVMDTLQDSTRPPALDNPPVGRIIPLHVRLSNENTVIFDGIRATQSSVSWSAGTPGYINRGIYGRVLPKGKYQIEITNVEGQPIFNGYRISIDIPGDSKV